MKSISLVKSTIRLGNSPTRFEKIQSKSNIREIKSNKQGAIFEIGKLEFVNRNSVDVIGNKSYNIQEDNDKMNRTNNNRCEPVDLTLLSDSQLKQDFDKAFRDLMAVSLSLREPTSQAHKNRHQSHITKHNTFPSIKSNSSNSIALKDWNVMALSKYEPKDTYSSAGSDVGENGKKPVPKPRQFISGDNGNKVNTSNEVETYQSVIQAEDDMMDVSKIQANVVKTRQKLFESLSQKISNENKITGE